MQTAYDVTTEGAIQRLWLFVAEMLTVKKDRAPHRSRVEVTLRL